MNKIIINSISSAIVLASMVTMTSCDSDSNNQKSTTSENPKKTVTVYRSGEIFHLEINGENGKETVAVKTGTVMVNGEEGENWVSAQDESQVASFLLMMYCDNLDYMKLCSKKLDKSKVDKALSEWKSIGGYYRILIDKDGNIGFKGGSSPSIFDIRGNGEIKFETMQEKTPENENLGKYVVTDIEFSK